MIESELLSNKIMVLSSQYPDFGTIVTVVAKMLAEKPIAMFAGSNEVPWAEIREFTIDKNGLSLKLSQPLIPESTLEFEEVSNGV